MNTMDNDTRHYLEGMEERLVSTITTNVTENVSNAVTGVVTDIVTKEVESLAIITQKGFDAVDKRLNKVETRLDRVENRLGGVEERLGTLEIRVDRGFAELDEKLDAEQRFTSDMRDEFSGRLAALERK